MSPEEQKIYQEFSDYFRNAMSEDDRLARFAEKLTKGEATYGDAWDYARRVGGQMSDALLEVAEEILLSEDGYNIVMSALHDGYQEAADYAAGVQTVINQEQGLGIRGIKPDFMKGRASGIAHQASNAKDLETTEYYLGSPAQHFTENVVGDTIKANEEFQYRSGLNPKIKRTAVGGCCEWCQAVAGEYDYPVSDEIYRRHANCDCLVEYYPGNGLKQNAHTKRWTKANEKGRIERQRRLQEEHDNLQRNLQHSVTMGSPFIEPELIKSIDFSRKFNQLTKNSRVNDIIRSLAKGNITRNNGTYTETLDIVDLDTGELVLHKRGKKDALEVELSEKERRLVRDYKGRTIGIHNHPTNIYPTGSDFVTAAGREYDFGIVVTHDLRVFKYTPPMERATSTAIDLIIDINTRMKYTDSEKDEGFINAMIELERRFGITWQEII